MSRRFPEAFLNCPRFASAQRQERADAAHKTPQPLALLTEARPKAVFVPEGYEPNYAYPLVVWFHDAGEDERTLRRLMPHVSDRNAVGLALRGERVRGGGFGWAQAAREARLGDLAAAIRELRRDCHVHTERVILTGRGAGAAIAAELFFTRPEWFGGLAMFDPPCEALAVDLTAREELAGKPVLLDLPLRHLGRGREGASRLAASGVEVTFRHTRSAGVGPEALRHLNRWLLGAVCGVSV
jgi:phospholipase/carboxylesterase